MMTRTPVIRHEHGKIRIAGIGTAAPPCIVRQDVADALMAQHYRGVLKPRTLEVMHQVLMHPSIRTRHIAVDREESLVLLKDEDPDVRMARFTRWAVDLSAAAVTQALTTAEYAVGDVAALVVNTCTGYICPGISTYLIEKLGLSPDVRAYDLVGSGCGGAIPCIQAGEQALAAMNHGVAVCVSVEICSATYQMGDDISLVISNAIFGDGAAATVLHRGGRGISLESSISRFDPSHRDDVRYVYKQGRLHNSLSPQLPRIVAEAVPPMIAALLSSRGLSASQVKHWAIHPGGERIIEELKKSLALSEEQLAVTREILLKYGNMSSPTVIFELQRMRADASGIGPGEWCVMVAFGAGFSAHAYLLRG
jgi:predicted naringenin-chalcone synthase